MVVRLYSKPGCHLCEQTLEMLERLRSRLPFELLQEDIRASPALLAAWRYSIPVVILDSGDTFRHPVVEAEVEACLRRCMGGMTIAQSLGQEE
jgi:hypothetical protein